VQKGRLLPFFCYHPFATFLSQTTGGNLANPIFLRRNQKPHDPVPAAVAVCHLGLQRGLIDYNGGDAAFQGDAGPVDIAADSSSTDDAGTVHDATVNDISAADTTMVDTPLADAFVPDSATPDSARPDTLVSDAVTGDTARQDSSQTSDAALADSPRTIDASTPAQPDMGDDTSVIFLQHPRGNVIWNGGVHQWFP